MSQDLSRTDKPILEWNAQELRDEFKRNRHLDEVNVITVLRKLQEILERENNVIEVQGKVTVCGDIHGQIFDLFSLFDTTFPLDQDLSGTDNKILFMGDYVDRGYQSIETFIFLAFLKVKYPTNVFLLRGNHESRQVNQMYGFFIDCQQIYGNAGIWYFCNETFDLLPLAAIVNNSLYCVHGGLSPHVPSIDRLEVINRRIEIPTEGPMADITWSDPQDDIKRFVPNRRGAGYLFGERQADEFLYNNNLKLIARSHQPAIDGFQYNWNKVLTVWSAPNYAYRMVNRATVLHVVGEIDDKKLPAASEDGWKAHNYDHSGLQYFKDSPESPTKPDDTVLDYFA